MKLFVAGFPNDFDEVDLREMFELYGEVLSAKLVTDRATGKSKGFGFIEMADRTEALQTIEALHGAAIKGKRISVQQAEEKPRTSNFGRNPNDRFNKRY
jgi:cold-inducible RNA-binding protein